MTFKITEEYTIREVQQEFQKHFPYLKIEFYKHLTPLKEGSTTREYYDNSLKLGELTGENKKGTIQINEQMKVSELEQLFYSLFGVTAQVYRRSGNIWLQTTTTDNWTLAEQNNHARQRMEPLPETNEEELPDYREQE